MFLLVSLVYAQQQQQTDGKRIPINISGKNNSDELRKKDKRFKQLRMILRFDVRHRH
jgi:hypothetical protein